MTHVHPPEDLLWDYHRGRLSPGMRLVVRTHMDLCPQCRSELRLFDQVGGALLEEIEGVAMSDTALDLAMARIERPDEPEPEPAATIKRPAFLEGFDLPESLKTANIPGRYWAAPGVWIAPVKFDEDTQGTKTYLMFVRRGMVMPEHTHRGCEITLMLKGTFNDLNGSYSRGDFVLCDETIQHSPAVGADEDCLCLVAQDGLILPKTLLGKLLQPFARI
ncbi:ChrR family anti-sigma-E factor [Asticcacaulis solisilvae]|uniref:ChrR family anti-sigma-E factor n=1 Tax=Asticcacaulis solisilvae TaxID=1217274 RepID=UPI003FD6C12F